MGSSGRGMEINIRVTDGEPRWEDGLDLRDPEGGCGTGCHFSEHGRGPSKLGRWLPKDRGIACRSKVIPDT